MSEKGFIGSFWERFKGMDAVEKLLVTGILLLVVLAAATFIEGFTGGGVTGAAVSGGVAGGGRGGMGFVFAVR